MQCPTSPKKLAPPLNFSAIVQELKQQVVELRMTRERVKHDVERANCNAEETEKDVATWQLDVDKITAEVGRLEEDIAQKKSCFNGLCPDLFARYRFGKQATKKKDAITKLRQRGNFSRVSYFPNHNLPGIEFYETKDFMTSASARSAFNMIMKELKDDKKKMIALHGMGGVGKTTLAIEVGKKAEELKLFDQVIMAVVSQCPSIEGIQGQIADMIGLRFEESSSVGKANRLRLRLEKIDKKILIVLDDLWAKLDLAAIGIPSGDDCTNCKVFLTTRQLQVCSSMGSQCNIPLDVLTDEEARALFNKCGGLSNGLSTLTAVAKSIANECKGLPLAIVTVATALKGKTPNEWEVALLRLQGSRYVGMPDADHDVYKCIRFSYDYLQDKEAKLCFLLCSLFPEDHSIEVEELVRYTYGLGLCRDVVDSIDRVRTELHVVITSLKASSLLSNCCDIYGKESEELVKMHDMVRDVALWIASEGRSNVSMVRAGMGLEEWPKSMDTELLTKISLMENKIAKHPSGLVYSRLNLLLLDGNGCYEFPDDFFDGMKALQVFSVSCGTPRIRNPFSLPRSIQHLSNLRTLRLEWLQLDDISILGKLNGLEILSLRGSHVEELPDTMGELYDLRMLDLSSFDFTTRIPYGLLRKLSKLEELYAWELGRDEGTCNAILNDLKSLSKLSVLYLDIFNAACLHEEICFPKHLIRYCIRIDGTKYFEESYPTSKELFLEKVDVAKLNAFKEIMPGVNSLLLNDIEEDCIRNIMPAVDQSGLHELTFLHLRCCHNMECLLDTTDPDWASSTACSRLDTLELRGMDSLRELISGLPPNGVFNELQKLFVSDCNKLCTVFPAKLSQRLRNLKEVTVQRCMEMKELFEFDLVCADVKENEPYLLSNMETLSLWGLPELTRIWKGPAIEVLSLVKLSIYNCPKLTSLLSLSQAPCLVQLQVLSVSKCSELKQIFSADESQLEIQPIGDDPTVWFPRLEQLALEELPNFISFWHESYIPPFPFMPSLEKLTVAGCPNIRTQFIADLQVFEKKLQVLDLERISLPKLSGTDVEGLEPRIRGFVKVDDLRIRNCKGVEELLQVEGVGNGSVGEHNNRAKVSSMQLPVSWRRLRLEYVAGHTCIWRGPSQMLILDNLGELYISECHGLKNRLLTTSTATSMLQLSVLEVKDCNELEQVFADDETRDHDMNNVVITLPKLSSLSLTQLPSLISFCPPRCHFIFPSLNGHLSVSSCPNNDTGFFCEARTRLTLVVHAKGEALCSTQNRGKCNYISPLNYNYRKFLPLYEEETDAETSVECHQNNA